MLYNFNPRYLKSSIFYMLLTDVPTYVLIADKRCSAFNKLRS